jgi:hypothetical protein
LLIVTLDALKTPLNYTTGISFVGIYEIINFIYSTQLYILLYRVDTNRAAECVIVEGGPCIVRAGFTPAGYFGFNISE